MVPLPRDMSFPLEKHEEWHLKYDYIKFPNTGKTTQQRNIIPGQAASPEQIRKGKHTRISFNLNYRIYFLKKMKKSKSELTGFMKVLS